MPGLHLVFFEDGMLGPGFAPPKGDGSGYFKLP